MFRSRTLAACLISSVFITPALARCELSKYVFKDQKGNEAVVKDVRECFGWDDREVESRSSTNICQTEKAVDAFIEKHPKRYLRRFGTRAIIILYNGKHFSIIENAIVGVPWLSYSVEKYTKGDYDDFKISRNVYGLLSTDSGKKMEFDFTSGSDLGGANPREAFSELFKKKFRYARCQ